MPNRSRCAATAAIALLLVEQVRGHLVRALERAAGRIARDGGDVPAGRQQVGRDRAPDAGRGAGDEAPSSRADRVPRGLQLQRPLHGLQRSAPARARGTASRWRRSGAPARRRRRRRRGRRCRRGSRAAAPTSARVPASRLTTPPGTSLVASTSARSRPGEREPLRHQRDDHVAARQRRAERLDQARQRRLVGRHQGDDADRLGHAEGEVRLRHLVDAAEHAGQLVGPARVVDGGLDAGGQLGAGGLGRHAGGGGDDARPARRCGPPAPRPAGTGSGRGCTRCGCATARARRARRGRRRARPCARPAARWRGARRPAPLTGTTRPDSERTLAPPIASL